MVLQFFIFGIVGVITTAIDFAIFNFLTGQSVGWRRIPANIVSVATAMTWSFFANWFIVFHPEQYLWLERAGRFLVTTAFSAFILQNAVLYFTTYVWKGPANLAIFLVRNLGLNGRLNDDLISRNTCKILAVSTGLIWNFFWYKFFVYAA